jgi:hypothetical protein
MLGLFCSRGKSPRQLKLGVGASLDAAIQRKTCCHCTVSQKPFTRCYKSVGRNRTRHLETSVVCMLRERAFWRCATYSLSRMSSGMIGCFLHSKFYQKLWQKINLHFSSSPGHIYKPIQDHRNCHSQRNIHFISRNLVNTRDIIFVIFPRICGSATWFQMPGMQFLLFNTSKWCTDTSIVRN